MSTPGRSLIYRLRNAAVITILASPVMFVQPTLATPPVTERVSLNSAGVEGDGVSSTPGISADGQIVVFASEATNLVDGDSNNLEDIFLHDWLTGLTSLVSVNSQGQAANGVSAWPEISGDGQWVAFSSTASDLVDGDSNGFEDIFVVERSSGLIERVSLSSSGTQANAASSQPALSADGRFVAFASGATNIFPGATSGRTEIYLYDRANQTLQWVSKPSGSANNGDSGEASISADGNWVAFSSWSSQLVSNDVNGFIDIFLWNLATGSLSRVSISSSGQAANSLNYQPALSGDGRFIAFRSHATNLVSGDDNGMADIFLRDQLTGSTRLVSVSSSGELATGPSDEPVISADGRFIAFRSYATNLVPGDSNSSSDIFLRDMQDSTTRVSVDSDGGQSNANDYTPAISADGAAVTFYSEATNLDLVLVDTNVAGDVFAHGDKPIAEPTATPTAEPTETATLTPTETPTSEPTLTSTPTPTEEPTPTEPPTETPTEEPTPTETATPVPTTVTPEPTETPTEEPTPTETATPVPSGTPDPTATEDPPSSSAAPIISLKTEASLKEGIQLTLSGSFQDPDSERWVASVDYGDGTDFQPLALTSSKSFKLRWVYGDNGDYTARVRIVDESGAAGSAELRVHVTNQSPQMQNDALHTLERCDREVKENGHNRGRSACKIGEWFVATVGQPTVFTLDLNDAGSDDLKIRWNFADEVTYYNNGDKADPYPSPWGTYPFHVVHSSSVIFDKPGVQYVNVDVYDDDGGKTSMQVKVLVRGAQSCRTSLGYWIKRFKDKDYSKYSGELRAHLSILSAFVTSSFGEFRPDRINALENFVLTDMRDHAQARAQLLTAWLNFTNGSVDWDERIDDADGSRDLPYADVLREILGILSKGGASEEQLKHAVELAESINLHNRRGRVCPVYSE